MTEAKALLAPVPHMHLESGLDTCAARGSVIFGSDRWGLFEDRGVEAGAPVYLYASLTQAKGQPMVSYQATYLRMYRHEDLGSDERKRRPISTEGASEGTFVVYWEVRGLERIEPFPITDLTPEDGSRFNPAFVPHGPVAIGG